DVAHSAEPVLIRLDRCKVGEGVGVVILVWVGDWRRVACRLSHFVSEELTLPSDRCSVGHIVVVTGIEWTVDIEPYELTFPDKFRYHRAVRRRAHDAVPGHISRKGRRRAGGGPSASRADCTFRCWLRAGETEGRKRAKPNHPSQSFRCHVS